MISVLILTRNEEKDLPGCLESVAWSDDIHVYDSFSDDSTGRIAQSFGARVTQRVFDNWAAHQNWGLANIPFRHPWVLYIDADERVTPELRAGIEAVLQAPGTSVAFRVCRRDFLMQRWLKNSQISPLYMRLFQPGKIRYERLVNPVSIPDGPVGDVSGYLDHYPFSKGMANWFSRHNSYSSLEAQQIAENRQNQIPFSLSRAFLGRDFHRKRFHQKELFYRLPGRPIFKFLLIYVFRRGFLDGTPGFTYACLQAIYEYMIVLKTRELKQNITDS